MKSVVQIANLKCGGCANTVKNNLLKLSGVTSVIVHQEASSVEVGYHNEELLEEIKESLSRMGYPELKEPNSIVHRAKSYASCLIGRMSREAD